MNTKYLLLSVIILINSIFVQSQEQSIKVIEDSNLSTEAKIYKIDSILNSQTNKDSIYYFKRKYAYWLYKNGKIKKAINLYEKASIYVLKKNKYSVIQKHFFWLGFYNSRDFNYIKSIEYYNKSINYPFNEKVTINSYYQLGLSYQNVHDYTKSNSHLYHTANLILKSNKYISLLLETYFNISTNYYFKDDLKTSILYAHKADSISKIVNPPNYIKYKIAKNLGDLYNEITTLNIKKSTKHYYNALEIAITENDLDGIIEIYLALGNLYNTTNYKKSINLLNLASKKISNNDSVRLEQLHFNYGLTNYFNNNYHESIGYFKKSISYIINSNFSNNINSNILSKIDDKLRVLHILPFLANAYNRSYKKTKDSYLLKKSIFYYKLSDQLMDLIKENSTSYKSRFFWREKSEKIYSRAIESCYKSNNIEDALFFMEKNKALLLSEDIAKQNYKLTLNINTDLLEKEKFYKKQLSQIELNKGKNKDSLLQIKLDLERQFSLFQDSIYEGKLRKNITAKTISKKEIQENLKQHEVFIEYHISSNNDFGIFSHNKNGYIILLTKNESYFVKLENLDDLKYNIKNYLKLLKKPLKTKNELDDFSLRSYQIYNALFPTEKIKSIIKNKKLTIVPDRILSFLPFETLISKNYSLKYLIYYSEISYAYSMTFQKENKLVKRTATNNYLGIAPLNFNYDSLANLPETKFEVNYISKLFNRSNILIGNNATKSNFLNISNEYNIIHFATHTDANNDKTPWIAFKYKKMFLNELYSTKTQADLIVLSACNTSLGKIITGEGVMSLARGFFFSGANSVVSSLWNVNDKSTTTLMTDFYKNINKGQTKSKALQQAKLEYLKSHSQSEISPYYWASFRIIGDTGKLHQIPNNHYWYYYLIRVLVTFTIILVVALIKRLLRRASSQ